MSLPMLGCWNRTIPDSVETHFLFPNTSRPVSSYDAKRGRRVIQTPYLLPGSTFSGLAEPTGVSSSRTRASCGMCIPCVERASET
eukprot:27049-Rhodomonas_salina.3